MSKIRIYGGRMTRFSKEIMESGLSPGAETEIVKNALSFTVVKPDTTLSQLENNLEIQLNDIGLRLGKRKLREVPKE